MWPSGRPSMAPCSKAPSTQLVPTLGPKVHKYDLLWAIWSPRDTQVTKAPTAYELAYMLAPRGRRVYRKSLVKTIHGVEDPETRIHLYH